MIYIEYHEVRVWTKKSALIRHMDHLCWVPLKFCTFKRPYVSVPEWLHPDLIWFPDVDNIELVIDASDIDENYQYKPR